MTITRAPIYAHLRPEDVQGDPGIKPEASNLLRGTYHAFRRVASERWKQHVRWGDQSQHPDQCEYHGFMRGRAAGEYGAALHAKAFTEAVLAWIDRDIDAARFTDGKQLTTALARRDIVRCELARIARDVTNGEGRA